MLKDFKEFIMKGNVLDLAVAVIIGAAFGAIVTSLVNDIIMPPIGMILGHIDFKDLFVSLNGQPYASLVAAKAAGAPVVAYGQFLNIVINFLIVASVVFLAVQAVTKLQKAAAPPPPSPPPPPPPAKPEPPTKKCPFCTLVIPLAAKRCPNCTSQLPEVR
jgi:large conductance mechanosensitive channel